MLAALPLSACGNPFSTPVTWWHDLEGGEIAADRPAPPGADLPYPHLGSIPAKPELPSASFRQTVQANLAAQRDDTERLAARNPVMVLPKDVPPPPALPPAPPADTASASLPGAESPASPPAPRPDAPPAPNTDTIGPAPGTPLTIAGAPPDDANLPAIPDAPPPPATFEHVAAQPAPTPPPPLPPRAPAALAGTTVLFARGSAALHSSQNATLKDIAARRGHLHIDIEGHGDTASDSPAAQATALSLGLQRAQTIATALAALHVPQDSLRLSATALGRDASVRISGQ